MGKRSKERSTTVKDAELLARVRVTVEEFVAQCHNDDKYRKQLLERIGMPESWKRRAIRKAL